MSNFLQRKNTKEEMNALLKCIEPDEWRDVNDLLKDKQYRDQSQVKKIVDADIKYRLGEMIKARSKVPKIKDHTTITEHK